MSIADKFNLFNEMNILRIICGAFFIPHIYAKFMVPEALGFFQAAKFKPAASWMYLACAVEVVLALGADFRHFHLLCRDPRSHPPDRDLRCDPSRCERQVAVEYRRLRISACSGRICCIVVAMHAWKTMH